MGDEGHEQNASSLVRLERGPHSLNYPSAGLAVTGLRSDQVVGKRVEEVLPQSSHGLVIDRYRQAIRERRRIDREEIAVFPAGTRVGLVTVAPIHGASGGCTHLLCAT